jgi:hypothetical protein
MGNLAAVYIISTNIEINAPASRVWSILTRFDEYQFWNPFIRSIEGRAEVGARLIVKIAPPGQSPITFRPRVLVATPNRELRWLGRLLVPGIFDGEHSFVLKSRKYGCRFLHSEKFSGLVVTMAGVKLLRNTEQGFRAMNEALKSRAEEGEDLKKR